MKRFVVFLLFAYVTGTCFGTTYNCYNRNELSGYYQIKNIENLPEQYRFVYEMQEDQIVGYYYDSNEIKFVDKIDGNRIIKSTYYAKETGNVLYEKDFFYGDDSKIKCFIYKQMNENGGVVYEMTSFFSKKDGKIAYYSNALRKKGFVEQRAVTEGLLREDYRPLEYSAYELYIDEKNMISQVSDGKEIFSYKKDCDVTSKLFLNGTLYRTKRRTLDKKTKKYEELYFDVYGKQARSKQYLLNGSNLTQIMKTNSEAVNEYNYSKIDDCCFLLTYNDWDDTSATKIETFDETVYLKNEVTEYIKYPINLFDFCMF